MLGLLLLYSGTTVTSLCEQCLGGTGLTSSFWQGCVLCNTQSMTLDAIYEEDSIRKQQWVPKTWEEMTSNVSRPQIDISSKLRDWRNVEVGVSYGDAVIVGSSEWLQQNNSNFAVWTMFRRRVLECEQLSDTHLIILWTRLCSVQYTIWVWHRSRVVLWWALSKGATVQDQMNATGVKKKYSNVCKQQQ